MTYHTDTRTAEIEWNRQCSRPGRPKEISRTNPWFIAGQQAHYWCQPRTNCPLSDNGDAARHWLAGWDDEAKAAHDRDRWQRNLEDTGHGW